MSDTTQPLRVGHRPVDSRQERECTICGQFDDHPRHTVAHPVGVEDVMAHFDCHAGEGCDVCAQALQDAPKDARHGTKLIAHLTKGM